MKKIFIAAVIVLSLVTSAFASTHSPVSTKAQAHLEANYSAATNVSWAVGNNFEKASITIGGEQIAVYYDEFGNPIGTSKKMAFDKLPKSALDILTTEYTFPDYQLTDCIESTNADNDTNYYVSFDLDGESTIVSISIDGAITQI